MTEAQHAEGDDLDIDSLIQERFEEDPEFDVAEVANQFCSDRDYNLQIALASVFQLRGYDYPWLIKQLNRSDLNLDAKSKSAVIREIYDTASAFDLPFFGSRLDGCGVDVDSLGLKSEVDHFSIGEEFGNLKVVDRIGVGGLVLVYRAICRSDGQSLAIRTPRRIDPRRTPGQFEALRKEFRLLEVLGSRPIPGIQKQLRWESTDFGPISICEFIDGLPLNIVDRSGFYARDILQIIAELADILEQLHARGVIHGDIKPENVLLAEDRSVHLIDFNVSLDSDLAIPKSTPFSGSHSYMGLDALAGGPPEVNLRRDVYAIGAMLYELIEGNKMVDASSREDAFAGVAVANMGVKDLFSESTPTSVRSIVTLATSRDVNNRFEFCDDVAKACRQAIQFLNEKVEPYRDPNLVAFRLGRAIGEIKYRYGVLVPLMVELISLGSLRKLEKEKQLALFGFSSLGEEGRNVVLLGKQFGQTFSTCDPGDFFSRVPLGLMRYTVAQFEDVKCRLGDLSEWIEAFELHCEELFGNTKIQSVLFSLGSLISEMQSNDMDAERCESLCGKSPLQPISTQISKVLSDERIKDARSKIQAVEDFLRDWLRKSANY
jgi:serine/threonine-protein kinase